MRTPCVQREDPSPFQCKAYPVPAHVHTWETITVVDKPAWDETVREAWDETVREAWDETVREAYDETVELEPAWDEPVYDEFYVCAKCGYVSEDGSEMEIHCVDVHFSEGGARYSVEPVQVGTIRHEAVTEVVRHEAEVVHHEAEIVHHEAEVVHHEAETHTETRCISCGETWPA